MGKRVLELLKSSRIRPLLLGLAVVVLLVAMNQWSREVDPWDDWDPGCPPLVSDPWHGFGVLTRGRYPDPSNPPPADGIWEAQWQPLGTELGVLVEMGRPKAAILKRWTDPNITVDGAQTTIMGRVVSWNGPEHLWMLIPKQDRHSQPYSALLQLDPVNGEVLQEFTPTAPAAVQKRPGDYQWMGFLPGTTKDEFLVGGCWRPPNQVQIPSPLEEHYVQVFDVATGALLREASAGVVADGHREMEKMLRILNRQSQPGGEVAQAMSATGIRWPTDDGELEWTPPVELTSRQPLEHRFESRAALQSTGKQWIQTDQIGAHGLALGLEMQGPRPLNALEQMRLSIRRFFWNLTSTTAMPSPRFTPMVPSNVATGRLLMGWHTEQRWESREMIGDLGHTTAASLRAGRSNHPPLRLLALDPKTALLIQEVRGTGGPAGDRAPDGLFRLGLVTTGDPRVDWLGTVDCPVGWWDKELQSYGGPEMIEVYASQGGLLLALHGARAADEKAVDESFWWTRVTPPADWKYAHLEGWLGPWAPPIPPPHKQSDATAR